MPSRTLPVLARPLLALIALLLAACAGGTPGSERWVHDLRADHPLAGRIYDPRAGRFVGEAEALSRAAGADFLLLGERHDNADHHRLQARVLAAALARGQRAVLLEMLTPEQARAAASFMAERPMDAAGFGAAVGWGRGWPDWSIYQPIGDIVLVHGAPIGPANLSQDELRILRDQGAAALPAASRARLRLDEPLPAAIREALEKDVADSHCGHIPAARLAPFAAIQWARDAAMADALAAAPPAVLIAGAGHVRTDRGVPYHLRAARPGARILAIAFREVVAGEADPAAQAWPYDLVWFTPRVDEVDFCLRFRERLRPAGRSGASAPTSPPAARRP